MKILQFTTQKLKDSMISSSIGSNLKIPNLEPSEPPEPPKIEP